MPGGGFVAREKSSCCDASRQHAPLCMVPLPVYMSLMETAFDMKASLCSSGAASGARRRQSRQPASVDDGGSINHMPARAIRGFLQLELYPAKRGSPDGQVSALYKRASRRHNELRQGLISGRCALGACQQLELPCKPASLC